MTISIDNHLVNRLLPDRSNLSHKGDFGSALVVAGSRHYTGAALLAGEACLRSGTGLVFMAVPACLHAAIAGRIPEAIWETLPCQDGAFAETATWELPKIMEGKSSVLIGPGLGQSPGTSAFIASLFEHLWLNDKPQIPLLLDADALNLLSSRSNWPALLPSQVALTPHYKEMSRLTGLSVVEIQENPLQLASTYAQQWQAVVVLKGATTVVASPNMEPRLLSQPTSSLAHGGTGDVLAGIIAGLLAQGIQPFDAATIAVFIHNTAAHLAEQEIGWSGSVLPRDIVRHLGRAFASIASSDQAS
jgi:NAD(P)H-hydrate epimerase